MPIPFPPDGPQVQAALQKVPTSQLQNYAAGRPPQPTGQVTPGPMGAAAEALSARGAMGAANQRQQAMQNNPANSPTIFQQKDMELQQKAQQLAAMGQQIQQKEQQLGVLGALMAKKAQDMQARESMGVANLPVRPDMFTAMDGGIVFSGGGGVKGYNGLSSSAVKLGGKSWDELSESQAEPASTLGELIGNVFSRGGKKIDPITGEPITLGEFLRRAERTGGRSSAVDTRDDVSELPSRAEPDRGGKEDKRPSTGQTTPSAPGIASLAGGSSFTTRMAELKPYLDASVDRSESAKLNAELIKTYDDIKKEIAAGRMTEEEGKRIIENKKAEMAAEYAEYTKGREARREKTRAALEGEAPTFQERLGRGLGRLPTDLRGVRLGGALAALGAGAAESDAEYTKRKREAAKYLAEAEELDAKADLAERRGQSKEAEAFRDKAEDRKLRSAQTNVSMLQAGQGGIKAALEQARAGETEEGRRLSTAAQAATNVQGSQIAADTQRDVARFNAENQRRLAEYQVANRERNPYLQMVDMLSGTGMDKKEAIAFVLGKGQGEGFSNVVMGKIAEDVIGKYANPHDPRVIAAVEKLDPNSAKILRLDPKDAMKQPGYAAALDIVERAKRQELLSSLGKSQNYTSLPAPPSR